MSRLVMRGADTSFTSPSGVPVFVGEVLVEGTGVTVRGVEAGPSDQVVLGTVNVASGAEWDAARFRGTEVTNVVFAAEATAPVVVSGDGCVAVSGVVVFDDVASGTPGLETEKIANFLLEGPLEAGLTLQCKAAVKPNMKDTSFTRIFERAKRPRLSSGINASSRVS